MLRGPLGQVLWTALLPLVDRCCRLRGGYGPDAALLMGFARHLYTPVLYVHASCVAGDSAGDGAGDGAGDDAADQDEELQRLYAATSGPKQMWRIAEPLTAPEVCAFVAHQPERLLAFAEQQRRMESVRHR